MLSADHWITADRALDLDEMTNNAIMFTEFFLRGYDDIWTAESIAAVLGNATAESSINPARWENDTSPPDPDTSDADVGYGLLQWTPYSKYRDWAGDDWAGNGDKQCARIQWEMDNGEQWIALDMFGDMSFREFASSVDTPEDLANVFLRSYERPADPDGTQAGRERWARYWYDNVVLPLWTKPLYWYLNGCYIFNRRWYGL